MRKSGWAVGIALGSLVLLLAACGGSSSSSTASTSTTGTASGTATQSTASSSSSSASAGSSSSSATSTAKPKSSGSSPGHTAGPQPSSNAGVSFPPPGTTMMIIMNTNLGWVMAKADEHVVYTYARDTKGGAPTCTGSCASVWAPVTGIPQAGPADTFPGTFTVVTGAGGQKVIAYNGYPLYTYIGAAPFSTAGNGVGGVWHVIKLSSSDIST